MTAQTSTRAATPTGDVPDTADLYYLGDPRRAAPERLRSILRQPALSA